jgi:DNA-binding transcriptional MerR regulator
MAKKLIRSKEIVEKFGITYPTLTNYTNLGLFTIVDKKGNKRLYEEGEIRERLPKIREMITQGYSLRLIRNTLSGNIRGLLG